MPPIVVNGRCLVRRVTGVERYAREVIGRLPGQVRLLRCWTGARGFGGHLWEQIVLPGLVRRGELLWSPANTGPLLLRNQVVTVHDLSPVDHPEWFNRTFALWYRRLLPALTTRARKVITDSAFSKTRIVARTGVPASKVVVIPPGVDTARFSVPEPSALQAAQARYGLSGRYVLAVGSLEPRKNLPRLVHAWEQLQERHPDVALVLVGSRAHTLRRVTLGDGRSLRLLGYVPDSDLSLLYGGATCLAIPSLYEGFGLPVLEAMACGAPVVAARAGALPEVVSDAGLLVDPLDVDQLAATLSRVVVDGDLRAALSQRGVERAGHFSWDRTAAAIWQVLCDVAEPGLSPCH